ncbi:hypothetical protein O3P69_006762 [Scylla paramamosain]|uniref:Uncharacterized protein n=1 Tax=Scylla paramamosain TaxID=85552 RepID=A0AAW0U0U4_SCYPA
MSGFRNCQQILERTIEAQKGAVSVCPGEPLARLELFLFTHLFQRFTFILMEEEKSLLESNAMFNAPLEYTARAKCRTK